MTGRRRTPSGPGRPARAASPGAAAVRELQAAVALHRAGRLAEAEAAYRRLLAADPGQADALHLLGLVAHQSGRPAEAVALVRRAIARHPAAASYHNTLGLALMAAGDLDAAATALARALALDPASADAHLNMGNLLRRRGDAAGAIGHYRQAIAGRPGFAEAEASLGDLFAERGEPEAAVVHFDRAVRLRPNDRQALAGLGAALVALDRAAEALGPLRRAVGLAPRDGRALLALGQALGQLDRFAEAAAALEQAVGVAPDLADAWVARARLARILGRFDEAQAHLDRALAVDADSVAALVLLAEQQRGRLTAERAARIESLAARPDLAADPRSRLRYALGLLAQDAGDYDAAFGNFAAANALQRDRLAGRGMVYDPAAQTRQVDRMIAAFDGVHFGRVAGQGVDSELPVFIVGMPRSGTTLVEQILASHSRVHGAGERTDVAALVGELSVSAPYPEGAAALSVETIGRVAGSHLDRLRPLAPSAARIVDKQPFNFYNLGLIATLFPRARIVHCRRDPMDTCLSCFVQMFEFPFPWACDLAALGHYYREYERLMAHWRATLPAPSLEVVYEETVADPETASRRLVAFCGLEWEAGCLAFHATERPVRTASLQQVRRPVYGGSVGQWRRYERHLGPLVAALGGG